jgi:UDP-glucose 4-epimerase
LPITEDTSLNPISPYGMTKKICEDIIINYSKNSLINYVILRYFNVAGNDFECDVCDNENNMKRIIPTIIKKALKNEIIEINGSNYNTKDGTCVRNYIHVLDLANAHIKALVYLDNNVNNLNNNNLICNIGCDTNYSIIELITIISRILNKKINYICKDKIEGDPAIVYCNNTLSKNVLKLDLMYSIDDIINSYIILLCKK